MKSAIRSSPCDGSIPSDVMFRRSRTNDMRSMMSAFQRISATSLLALMAFDSAAGGATKAIRKISEIGSNSPAPEMPGRAKPSDELDVHRISYQCGGRLNSKLSHDFVLVRFGG